MKNIYREYSKARKLSRIIYGLLPNQTFRTNKETQFSTKLLTNPLEHNNVLIHIMKKYRSSSTMIDQTTDVSGVLESEIDYINQEQGKAIISVISSSYESLKRFKQSGMNRLKISNEIIYKVESAINHHQFKGTQRFGVEESLNYSYLLHNDFGTNALEMVNVNDFSNPKTSWLLGVQEKIFCQGSNLEFLKSLFESDIAEKLRLLKQETIIPTIDFEDGELLKYKEVMTEEEKNFSQTAISQLLSDDEFRTSLTLSNNKQDFIRQHSESIKKNLDIFLDRYEFKEENLEISESLRDALFDYFAFLIETNQINKSPTNNNPDKSPQKPKIKPPQIESNQIKR